MKCLGQNIDNIILGCFREGPSEHLSTSSNIETDVTDIYEQCVSKSSC